MLATVTGAAAASRFGIAGTLTGTVVTSVASSAGTTIYQHYLNRGGDKVRAIPGLIPRPRVTHGGQAQDWGGAAAGPDHIASGGAAPATIGSGSPGGPDAGAGGTRYLGTDEPSGNGHPAATSVALIQFPAVSGGFPAVSSGGSATSAFPSVSSGGPVTSGPPSAPGDFPSVSGGMPEGNGAASPDVQGKQFNWREADWKRVAVVTATTLVLAIAIITVIELVAGRPLGAIIGGQHASGTSIGSVIARHPSTGQPQRPSGPGSSAPGQAPAQPANTAGPTPGRSQPGAPTPVPSAPATPSIGGAGGTGNAASRTPTAPTP